MIVIIDAVRIMVVESDSNIETSALLNWQGIFFFLKFCRAHRL